MPYAVSRQQVQTEIARYQVIRDRLCESYPDLDDETLADTLEGITSLQEMIAEVVRSALDDQALVAGLKQRLNEMRARCERLQFRADRKRQLALEAMGEAGIRKLTEPDFTVSMRAGAPGLVIQAEDRIPEHYWLPQPAKLDRQGLLAALKGGQPVAGVTLSNPEPTLAVRTK